jgi:hypothetical protein
VTPDRPRDHPSLQRKNRPRIATIARRIVACVCDQILTRLFVTLASANHRTISDTQPGRERPRDRPSGQGQGSGRGVAHVPAALRGTVRVGRNRRRAVIELAGVGNRKLSQRIRLRVRAALKVSTRSRSRAHRYSRAEGGDGRPGVISPSSSPSSLCHVPRRRLGSTVRHWPRYGRLKPLRQVKSPR